MMSTFSLDDAELRGLDALWRAANYLSVGQIYLLANPLLREPLTLEHVKPRLLGHWGTTGLGARVAGLRQAMVDERLRLRRYTRVHGDDAPEVRDWTLPDRPSTREEPARGHQA